MVPSIVFVLGKGGVGRSTVAAALGSGLAARGSEVLIVQWTISDAISPWFSRPPAAYEAQPLAPRLATLNFAAEAALEQYFVAHLGLRAFYRTVMSNNHVRRATRAAPGLEELMFLGMLMWLNSLAFEDVGFRYDHVIVDAPAMGHGTSLLAMPRVTNALGFGGQLAIETTRVGSMLADPARLGAVVVTTPEELAVEETCEFWPRITHDLGRAPLALIVNRSAQLLEPLPAEVSACPWWPAAGAVADTRLGGALERVYAHLARRRAREGELLQRIVVDGPLARLVIDDAMLAEDVPTPLQVVQRATAALEPFWSAP